MTEDREAKVVETKKHAARHDEQIEGAIILASDFPYAQLLTLAPLLEKAGVFTPGYGPPEIGLCHPLGFIHERDFEGIRTILLPDRNIASRFAQIAKGAPATPELRLVAAVKAFCHFLDILVEPSVAFHELAHKQGNDAANEELAWFRVGDDGDAFAWFDYATGRIDRVPASGNALAVPCHDLAFPLRRWRRNYIACLKIAELEMKPMSNLQRLLTLLDWMRDDFMIAGPATTLACIYFAPNSPPRKGLLKKLSSPDRRRALDGVRNAAWDVTHLSDFAKKVNEAGGEEVRYLFASTDKTLHRMASFLFEFGAEGIWTDAVAEGLSAWWPVRHAEQISARLAKLLEDAANPRRAMHNKQPATFIDDLIERGERLVLQPAKP